MLNGLLLNWVTLATGFFSLYSSICRVGASFIVRGHFYACVVAPAFELHGETLLGIKLDRSRVLEMTGDL